MWRSLLLWSLMVLLAAATTSGQGFSGSFADPQGAVSLVLEQDRSGSVAGRLRGSGVDLEVEARVVGSEIVGTAGALRLTARLCPSGDHLTVDLVELDARGRPQGGPTSLTLTRRSTAGARPETPGRQVVINGRKLSDETVSSLEIASGVRILDGSYWYDKACGAWGFAGGPTVGFILAGLDLGGPLRADASNGNTGVFVNGRELHFRDVVALRQLVGTVLPGRYWLDAAGNVGVEGGYFLFNLAQLAAASGGSRGGTFRNNADGSWGYRNQNTGVGIVMGGGEVWIEPD